MGLKKILEKILPIDWYNYLRMCRYNMTSRKTFLEAEREINRLYEKKCEGCIDWNNPTTYTEKVNYSKLYGASSVKTKLTDKVAVREWVKEKIGSEYLIPLLGVYDSFEEIPFGELPNQFVIKCNHDSASVNVCDDKEKIDLPLLKKQYNFFLKRNYAYMTCEMHYKDIPHRIIIEQYMGSSICDYKFLCFNGKPEYCWVDVDRFANHKRNVYDMDWNLQPFNQMPYGNSESTIEKPKQFEKMKWLAEVLCEGFDHVRVDLYFVDGKVYFGEMTFTNGSGTKLIDPSEWDKKIGDLWKLDTTLRNKVKNKNKLRLKDYQVE